VSLPLPSADARTVLGSSRMSGVARVRQVHRRGSRERATTSRQGSLDRVKDQARLRETRFPSSGARGHPLSPARRTKQEEPAPHARTDQGHRSCEAPRRAPLSRGPGCLPPSRCVSREICISRIAPDLSPTPPRSGPCRPGAGRTCDRIREDERLFAISRKRLGRTPKHTRKRGSEKRSHGVTSRTLNLSA